MLSCGKTGEVVGCVVEVGMSVKGMGGGCKQSVDKQLYSICGGQRGLTFQVYPSIHLSHVEQLTRHIPVTPLY